MGKPRIAKSVRARSSVRRIAVVTGTRAEYGLLRSMLRAIQSTPALKLQLIVTGMHLLTKFGRTVRNIEEDGFEIAARIKMQKGDDSAGDQAEGLGRGVVGISRLLLRAKTDVVLVLGDRIEAMAGALAAVTTGKLLAHIHGGDVAPGDFDDSLRHAISKLAHIHFPASRQSAARLIRMGEERKRIFVVGPPGFDEMPHRAVSAGREPLREEPFALVVQHPCGRADQRERMTMGAILESVRRTGLGVHILYPNSDRGHSGILQAIDAVQARNGQSIKISQSLPREEYLHLLGRARLLIGNSSSGLLEAGRVGTAVVNVGDRQAGRENYGGIIFHASESPVSIQAALKRALSALNTHPKQSAKVSQAGKKIATILSILPLHGVSNPSRRG